MKYVIIGFPKCGQVSLVEWLKKQGHEAIRNDIIWKIDAVQTIKQNYIDKGYIPIIITRDPVERIWSGFNYWHYRTRGITLPDYLKMESYNTSIGEENPIKQSDYLRYAEPYKKYNVIIYKLEELQEIPGFPHENKTQKKEPFAPGLRRMIDEALKHKHLYSLPEETT